MQSSSTCLPLYSYKKNATVGLCANLQVFDVASVQVRLLFESGMYMHAGNVCETHKYE